ncbi:Os02g0193500, partial [Oryza sativa Japonica Group]
SSSSSSPARSPTAAATPDRRRSPGSPARAGECRDKGGVVEYRVKEREISPRLVVSSAPRAAAKTSRGGGAAIEQSRGGEGILVSIHPHPLSDSSLSPTPPGLLMSGILLAFVNPSSFSSRSGRSSSPPP